MNSTLALISSLGLGLGLETSGLGLETPGLVNIPASKYKYYATTSEVALIMHSHRRDLLTYITSYRLIDSKWAWLRFF